MLVTYLLILQHNTYHIDCRLINIYLHFRGGVDPPKNRFGPAAKMSIEFQVLCLNSDITFGTPM